MLDVDLGLLALGVVQRGERRPVRVGCRRREVGGRVEQGQLVVGGAGDGHGDVEPVAALGTLHRERAALAEERLGPPGQFGGDGGHRAVAVPHDGRDRGAHELLAGQPVRGGQPARLQVSQVRRQDEPLLGALGDGRGQGDGPPPAPHRPLGTFVGHPPPRAQPGTGAPALTLLLDDRRRYERLLPPPHGPCRGRVAQRLLHAPQTLRAAAEDARSGRAGRPGCPHGLLGRVPRARTRAVADTVVP
ncbi:MULTISPECIES: hypothetical protein [Streptomyces]|uniref:hypothetical protein n=1 Tax=Streptomyces TaxID=1883 RepID=UPI001CEF901D|nr:MULTISPECIES: hypothetical protein [Streptomyces]